MIQRLVRTLALCLAAAGASFVFPACSSTPDAESTVGSMSSFGVETAKVKDSIDAALRALDTLVTTQPGDIQANYEGYSKAVRALDAQAEIVRRRAEEMRAQGNEFFAEWEGSNGMTPERRAQLTASYEKIEAEMTSAKEEFVPFQKSLQDIEGYVKLDRSLEGVRATADLSRRAREHGTRVKARIDAVLVQLNSVRGMLSTKS